MVKAAEDISLTVTEDERAQIEYDVPGADLRASCRTFTMCSRWCPRPRVGRASCLWVALSTHRMSMRRCISSKT